MMVPIAGKVMVRLVGVEWMLANGSPGTGTSLRATGRAQSLTVQQLSGKLASKISVLRCVGQHLTEVGQIVGGKCSTRTTSSIIGRRRRDGREQIERIASCLRCGCRGSGGWLCGSDAMQLAVHFVLGQRAKLGRTLITLKLDDGRGTLLLLACQISRPQTTGLDGTETSEIARISVHIAHVNAHLIQTGKGH